MITQNTLSSAGTSHTGSPNGSFARLVRFGVVGAAGTLVNSGLLLLGVKALHVAPWLAAPIAAELSVISNFLLNDRWTFRGLHSSKTRWQRLIGYNVVASSGLLISVSALVFLTQMFHTDYLVANLVGIALSAVWNYVGSTRFAWKESRPC